MHDLNIECPQCKTAIPVTESIAAPLLQSLKQNFEKTLQDKDRETNRLLTEQKTQSESEKKMIQEQAENRARMVLANDIEQKNCEIQNLQETLKQRDQKLVDAQKTQTEYLKKERALEDAKREIELTIEKQVQSSLDVIRTQSKKEAESQAQLKITEKEQIISSMQKQIEELKRKAEQGSQQLQGEVLELELEFLLKEKFPQDKIDPVAKGEFGGDILQTVMNGQGIISGTILWECKRTKNWSDLWLGKLRDDKHNAKADLAILLSHTLPKGIENFDFIDNIWVVHPKLAIPVSLALRQMLIESYRLMQVNQGQQTKQELVYQYLTGPRFLSRIQMIVEKFDEMKNDLDRERKTMMRLWAKREEQIRGILESTSGMYGDLQGIAGKSLKEIEALQILEID